MADLRFSSSSNLKLGGIRPALILLTLFSVAVWSSFIFDKAIFPFLILSDVKLFSFSSSLISSCIGFLSMSEDMDNIFFCKDDESFTMKMVSVVSEINAVNNK